MLTNLSPNARGAVLMSATMAAFALNDMMIKWVSTDVNLFQAIMIRGLFMIAALALVCHRRGYLAFRPAADDRRRLVWRTIGEVGQTVTYLNALYHMPIANVAAILQSLPLAMTLGAAVFLREPVGWRRLAAIVAGFMGVLMIVRPGPEGFNAYALSALGTVGFVVLRDLITRRLNDDVPSLFIALLTALSVTTFAAIAALFQEWRPVSVREVGMLAVAAGFLIFGYLFVTMAMRVGDVSFSAPFRYTILLWSLLIGALMFNEIPRPLTLAGAALIVVSGIYTFYRERRLQRSIAASSSPANNNPTNLSPPER